MCSRGKLRATAPVALALMNRSCSMTPSNAQTAWTPPGNLPYTKQQLPLCSREDTGWRPACERDQPSLGSGLAEEFSQFPTNPPGCTAGEGRREPYGKPLLDDPMQCPGRSDASGESSLHRAEISPPDPGTAGADDPGAKDTSRSWPLLSGVLVGEISRSLTKGSKDAGLVPVQAEQCHTWIQGQVTPVETFLCPIESNHPADIFCCGTCTASYCCSSPKDRLDQTSCSRVTEETEDQGAGETSPEDLSTIKNIGLVLIIIGATCLCIWIAFVIFHFRDRTEMIMLDNEHPEMVLELPAPAPVDPPMPGPPPAASGNPDPASLGLEESQRSSELPMAVAGGSGSPMDEETISPAVLLEGNLEVQPEEEETAL
ncbi:uncharacterized protein LOC117675915 [Pantherophis guttatus]|uniref:Uncharacterized protein LOC117675915 n=1 Tax=Pantherophis guttatus TaxID=94885 RepID=A0A6P9D5B7_PANGU|nr:uncharacterized protein LOC117675915 [Pantherophis guttatus]